MLISLPEIAALAKVQRPVVSMWRSRFSTGDTAFPAPVQTQGGQDHFDAAQVAHWLSATRHGNNPEVVADVAAFAAPEHWNAADSSHVRALFALIALRASDGLPMSAGDLTDRAHAADPADVFIASEVNSRDLSIDWAGFVDQLIDAAYSPLGAWNRLDARATIEARVGAVGPLKAELAGVFAGLVHALGSPEQLVVLDAPGELSAHELIAATVASAGEDREITVRLPPDTSARHVRRHLVVLGLGHVVNERVPASGTPAVQLARLLGRDPVRELADLEDLIVDLSEAQYAIVIGPASLLVDQLAGAGEQSRDAMLRSGRVRAIGRLGAGWIPTAPRTALAFWVIGAAQHDVPIADRFAVVGDLSDVDLTPARMGDVIGDVLAGLGGAPAARRHSFRYLRVVRTSSLVAGGRLVIASAAAGRGTRLPDGLEAIDALPALVDETLSDLGAEAPKITLTPVQRLATASVQQHLTVGQSISAQELLVLSGTRLRAEDIATGDGFPVLGRAELGQIKLRQPVERVRRIDRLRLLADYPRAELTQPGDVVFMAGAEPRAMVDRTGSSVVEYPARVLRIRSRSLASELVAADINAQQSHSSWRDWTLRRVPPESRPGLSASLAEIESAREAVIRQLASLDRLEHLILSAVAAGNVANSTVAADASLGNPTTSQTNDDNPATEGAE